MSLSKKTVSLLILLLALPAALYSQPLRGVTSAGYDFYVGYVPGLRHPSTYIGAREAVFLLVGSFQDNNAVDLYYFDSTNGLEYRAKSFNVRRGEVAQIALDQFALAPTKPGEVAEYRSLHIVSQYPVTVQVYQEGSSTGGMYSAMPTPALGSKYVIASYKDYDATHPGWLPMDSSSSWFMLVAAYDSTRVTYEPTATTYGGTVGMNSGPGHDGKAHPVTRLLRRGQIWYVRSLPSSDGDLSGSTVSSDKPIAVLAGQECALLGDPSAVWTALDNDIRDILVEQMTPVHAWGTEYPSIPFAPPPSVARLLVDGKGDMYRLLGDSATNMITFDSSGTPATVALTRYQYPVSEFYTVEKAVDISSRYDRPFYALIYDKFQGAHTFDPGSGTRLKGDKLPLDETSYTTPNEMNLIPLDHFVTTTIFEIPKNSTYRGSQFFNIICVKDSLDKIDVAFNGAKPKPLSAYGGPRYDIPSHPELVGLRIQPSPGSYLISGHTPFACYSYGRTEGQYKDGWGYAAPAGQSYADLSDLTSPKVRVVKDCESWRINILDTLPSDKGIAHAVLLNDPDSVYTGRPLLSKNIALTGNFIAGARAVEVMLRVIDSSKTAFGALYIEDLGGHDTILTFSYEPPLTVATNSALTFGKARGDTCKTVFLSNHTSSAVNVMTLSVRGDPVFHLSNPPALPLSLASKDSLPVTICYSLIDTLRHTGYLTANSECSGVTLDLIASGQTGILSASDRTAQVMDDTTCFWVTLTNIGSSTLAITNATFDNPAFYIQNRNVFPVTLPAKSNTGVAVCYAWSGAALDSVTISWQTDVAAPFQQYGKPFSKVYAISSMGVVPTSTGHVLPALVVTPNPAHSDALAHVVNADRGQLEVYDILGSRVLVLPISGSDVDVPLNLKPLPSGTYVVRLTCPNGILSRMLELR